jgi:hypothetical protein
MRTPLLVSGKVDVFFVGIISILKTGQSSEPVAKCHPKRHNDAKIEDLENNS